MGDAQGEKLFSSSQLRVEKLRLDGASVLPWQRCPVADRVVVIQEGHGYLYRTHGRDEVRDEVGAGDVVYVQRMIWHQLVPAADRGLVATVVTHVPSDVELRR